MVWALVRLLLFRLLPFCLLIGSSNPVLSTNEFELRFAHGWVVNLLSLQPSGMHNQRKGKEQTIFKGGTARSGQKKLLVRIFSTIL